MGNIYNIFYICNPIPYVLKMDNAHKIVEKLITEINKTDFYIPYI